MKKINIRLLSPGENEDRNPVVYAVANTFLLLLQGIGLILAAPFWSLYQGATWIKKAFKKRQYAKAISGLAGGLFAAVYGGIQLFNWLQPALTGLLTVASISFLPATAVYGIAIGLTAMGACIGFALAAGLIGGIASLIASCSGKQPILDHDVQDRLENNPPPPRGAQPQQAIHPQGNANQHRPAYYGQRVRQQQQPAGSARQPGPAGNPQRGGPNPFS